MLAGCGSCSGPGSPEEELEDKGFLDLMKEVSDDEYDPPSDGKLTEDQVQMYLKVKEKDQELVQAAQQRLQESAQETEEAEDEGRGLTAALRGLQTLGRAGDLATLDIRAASELGYNTAEYSWVKGQILEATLSTYRRNMQSSFSETMEENLKRMKEARDKAPNESTRQAYDAQIKAIEQNLAESKNEQAQQSGDQEALAHNQRLIEKYRDQMKVLEDEMKRFHGLGR